MDFNGKTIFLISFDEDIDNNEVAQHFVQSNLESRVSILEKQIQILHKSASVECEIDDGPGEIRTPDLCRVKATS